eukprot:TRINITY_DN29989_c0_g1_i1.p1 TRINITY_DN29989_c0_g1~~TRINITY_DN29989_c0_g1_i1.p1  ORF type:complete len:390 (-),score=36.97 TRINITY_DN29989_c0_g1_i1:713-1882(-)
MSSTSDLGQQRYATRDFRLSVKNTFVSARLLMDEEDDSFWRQTSDPTSISRQLSSQARDELPSQDCAQDGADLDEDDMFDGEDRLFGKSGLDAQPSRTGLESGSAAAERCVYECASSKRDETSATCDTRSMCRSSSSLPSDANKRQLVLSEALSFEDHFAFEGQRPPAKVQEGAHFMAFEGQGPTSTVEEGAHRNEDVVSKVPLEWQGKTSVMLKNIPYVCTYQGLRDALQEAGFAHDYDYMYMPMDADTSSNRGYAFINFLNDEAAYHFRMHFNFRKWQGGCSWPKLLEVTPANLQGTQNRTRFSSCRKLRKKASPTAEGTVTQVAQSYHNDYMSFLGESPMHATYLMQHLLESQQQVRLQVENWNREQCAGTPRPSACTEWGVSVSM